MGTSQLSLNGVDDARSLAVDDLGPGGRPGLAQGDLHGAVGAGGDLGLAAQGDLRGGVDRLPGAGGDWREAVEAVEDINYNIWDNLGLKDDYCPYLELSTNGDTILVKFLGEVLWNSEDDYRDYIDEENSAREPLKDYLLGCISELKSYIMQGCDFSNDTVESKPTTKVCSKCGCTETIPMSSTDTKLCSNGACLNEIPWPLDEGQSKVL